MAAPVASTRVAPPGIKLRDGWYTHITFAADTDIDLWEHISGIGIPAQEGGDAIETTTFHNTTGRTRAPRAIHSDEPFDMICAFDPNVRTQIRSIINVETTITQRYPDGSTEAFYGYLQRAVFAPLVEGQLPLVTVTVVPTRWDQTNKVEAAPVFTNVAGT